ncbi:MAG: hypothetical protein HY226_00670 [Candidatus Vogelbacteria bacterium]|nr:hypothetical protein [Candidatus Vogelbacteria bacterium]
MDYHFASIIVFAVFYLLVIIPGMLSLSLPVFSERISKIDLYEKVALSLMAGLGIWVPISIFSYAFNVRAVSPIYISLVLTGLLFFYTLYKRNLKLNGLFGWKSINRVSGYLNLYTLFIVIASVLIGYVSQFQTGDADAFAHLAAIRNLATHDTIQTCDWILGNGAPMVNAYGCHPWYLTLGMIVKFSNVDAAFAYATLSGIVYFISILSIYTLIKTISGDVFIAKIGSIIFAISSVMNWFLAIGDAPYYSLDPINNLLFPQHFTSYILMPIMLAIFIKYILRGEKIYLFATLACLLIVARFHPIWMIWAPTIFSGVIIFRNLFKKKLGLLNPVSYKVILFFAGIVSLATAGYLLCKNIYSQDVNIISPLALWQRSGGNVLVLTDNFYLYDPLVYLKDRGAYDILTIGLLWYLYKYSRAKTSPNIVGEAMPFNEMWAIYLGAFTSIALVIFNPPIVLLMLKVVGSAPLYRIFGLMMPILSCFTIGAILIFLKLKIESKYFKKVVIAGTILVATVIGYNHSEYIVKMYSNAGKYYSTFESPIQEPFVTLRSLGTGNIAVRTPLATAIAALTDLDPITTEVVRNRSTFDIALNKQDDEALLAFSKSPEVLQSILKRRRINYIMLSKDETDSINNLSRHPELVHFRSTAGTEEIWEVNENY